MGKYNITWCAETGNPCLTPCTVVQYTHIDHMSMLFIHMRIIHMLHITSLSSASACSLHGVWYTISLIHMPCKRHDSIVQVVYAVAYQVTLGFNSSNACA